MEDAPVTGALTAYAVVAFIVLGTVVFALFAVRRVKMDPQQYMVGGRSFGALFLWILLAGEVYTSFTFLGAAGWAYSRGAPALYILAYGTVAYILGYFFLPAVWRVGKAAGLLTSADFFLERFDSRALAGFVAVLQFIMIVPYVTLQLSGLQILLTIAGYGHYHATATVGVAFLLIALFVFTAGLRGTAWASVIKDVLVLGAVIFAGIFLPIHFFGSPAHMLDRVLAEKPNWLTLSGAPVANGLPWFVSTVLLTGIGFYMGPHSIAACYSARSEDALRRNAIFLPIYQLVLLLVFFAGFAALLIVPGLKPPASDQSFMLVVQKFYAPWVLGVVAGAGCLAALLPASALLLGAASVLSKNVLGDLLGIATGDAARTLATRLLVVAIAVMALAFWLFYNKTLVELLLLYYNGITQFMPGFVFGLIWKRVSALGVGVGIVGGITASLWLSVAGALPLGLNPGFFGLLLNVAIVAAFAAIRPRLVETSSSLSASP